MTHVAFNAIVFVGLFTVCLFVPLCLYNLNSIHELPPQVYTLAGRLKIWLFYPDGVLTAFMLAFMGISSASHTLEDAR